MIYYKYFKEYKIDIVGKKKRYSNNIYTFDIETSSYLKYKNKIYNVSLYEELTEKEREEVIPMSSMYIWMFSVNEDVYYGRNWDELKDFLYILDEYDKSCKIVFVHNLAFEFQYLYSNIQQEKVFARKSHKVIKSSCSSYNIEFRCSYMMSNAKLENLPKLYNLKTNKLVGSLDYSKIRHSETILTDEELAYCKNDCLILYEYINFLKNEYKDIHRIPTTSTGQVRKELRDLTIKDFSYKSKVRRSINTDPHIYNMLVHAFQGGYTHSNWIYTNEVLKNIDSWDETSAYPFVMVAYKFPSTKFKKCIISSVKDMSHNFAYLLHVRFKNIKSKYHNSFISASKCMNLKGASYDNGRIIKADYFEMILTDIDFYLYLDSYSFEYEIIESHYSVYKYLPIKFIKFILEKYVKKTEYKGIAGKEIEYNLEKQKFNALYGMSVTNIIKDNVLFEDGVWTEEGMENEEILEKLKSEEKKAFLSFSYGVWVTAYARDNLLRRIIDLDNYLVYADTDSLKLIEGYDKNIIYKYNKEVEARINKVSKLLRINIDKYAPKDKKGNTHMLGLFELEKEDYQFNSYKEFITQGAKKYAVKETILDEKTNELKDVIKITVAGVPKDGAKALTRLEDFKDGLVFKYKDTNKNLLFYCDNQESIELTDYLGKTIKVFDKSGCCLVPNTYTLGKSLDYAHLLSDDSSKRNYFKE